MGFLRLTITRHLGLLIHRKDRVRHSFVTLMLLPRLHEVVLNQNWYQRMTMKKLLLTLPKRRVQHIQGRLILSPLIKKQKAINIALVVRESCFR